MSNGTTREKQTERVIHAMTIGLCKDLFNDVIIEIITQDVREQEHPSLREMNRNRETYSIAEEVNESILEALQEGHHIIEMDVFRIAEREEQVEEDNAYEELLPSNVPFELVLNGWLVRLRRVNNQYIVIEGDGRDKDANGANEQEENEHQDIDLLCL